MTTVDREAKKLLRSNVHQRVSSLTEVEVSEQSQQAQQAICSLPQFQQASRVSIYLAMPNGEVRTDLILKEAFKQEKKVFVPYINSKAKDDGGNKTQKFMDMMQLKSLQEYENLRRDKWGIPSLSADSVNNKENALGGYGPSSSEQGKEGELNDDPLDFVVVPGVAFDAAMSRLGHGAGYYDKFFARMDSTKKRPMPFLVGLCLTQQVLQPGAIMMNEWDWRVDAVAVGDGRILTRKGEDEPDVSKSMGI